MSVLYVHEYFVHIFSALVSPALSYLGGLPPLLFIVSDKEVLRDEILYTCVWDFSTGQGSSYIAHTKPRILKSTQYKTECGTCTLYCKVSRRGIRRHLCIYKYMMASPSTYNLRDLIMFQPDTAHILPVLFSSTTPAKFCFRAIASFCKYVTGSPQQSTSSSSLQVPLTRSRSGSFSSDSNSSTSQPTNQLTPAVTSPPSEMTEEERLKSPRVAGETLPEKPSDQRISLKSLSQKIAALSRRDPSSSPLRSATEFMAQKSPERRNSKTGSKTTLDPSERYAGEASIYHEGYVSFFMIL